MGDKLSHKKGEEKGNFYQIKCIKDVVRNKEARGEDASFERNLLKHWSKYKGWESASLSVANKPKSSGIESLISGNHCKQSIRMGRDDDS